MNWKDGLRQPGVPAALGAALLFDAGTPLAKWLLDAIGPWLLAGLLYLGSGLGLTLYRRLIRDSAVRLRRHEAVWFAGAILAGGHRRTGAADDRADGYAGVRSFPPAECRRRLHRTAGIVCIQGERRPAHRARHGGHRGRRVRPELAGRSAVRRTVADLGGSWRLLRLRHRQQPDVQDSTYRRHLGTARTAAYFSVAPFFGAVLAVQMGEALTPSLLLAGALMALGTWLHLTKRHGHGHTHENLGHDHEHVHDEHHQHDHDGLAMPGVKHSHPHWHKPLTHTHPHFPDAHHRHPH